VIRLFERLGWASDVHWPDYERIQRRRADHLQQARVLAIAFGIGLGTSTASPPPSTCSALS
jgi:hypothetical protein